MPVLQISLNNQQYSALQNRSHLYGVSAKFMAKVMIVQNGKQILLYYRGLLNLLSYIPSGTEFSVKSLFGWWWKNIPRSVSISIGREFKKNVDNKVVSGIISLKKDTASTQWYKKL